MTIKADFTAEEWKQLLRAPSAVGIYIMMSDQNFVVGSMKEAFAVSSSIIKKTKGNNSELLAAMLGEFKEREMAKQAQLKFEEKNVDAVKQTTFDALKQAARVLDQKATPEEAAEVKAWLYEVSIKVANAAKEGGFLGFGGEKVSENEKVALQEIAGQLGISA